MRSLQPDLVHPRIILWADSMRGLTRSASMSDCMHFILRSDPKRQCSGEDESTARGARLHRILPCDSVLEPAGLASGAEPSAFAELAESPGFAQSASCGTWFSTSEVGAARREHAVRVVGAPWWWKEEKVDFPSYQRTLKKYLSNINNRLDKIETAIAASDDALRDRSGHADCNSPEDGRVVDEGNKRFWRSMQRISTTLPPAALATAWTEFRAYLTAGVPVEVPATYKALRPLVSQIRCPYYAQSLALISGCVQLARIFANQKTFDMFTPFNMFVFHRNSSAHVPLKKLNSQCDRPYHRGPHGCRGIPEGRKDPTVIFSSDVAVSTAFDTATESIKMGFQHFGVRTTLSFERS
ncbi:hypothetical protein C8R43DRAFT_961322 [Mycena crocata]|nr:hypothetical protein C8R43DRAFT_961322 [Mycena crocata]